MSMVPVGSRPPTPPSDRQQAQFWADLALHRSYLADTARNDAYRAALAAVIRPGDTVLDLGSGTGILSLMAARAGAARVLGVDWSALVEPARRAAARNGFFGRVDFLSADIRRVHLGDHPFLDRPPDVIVHELIGGLFWDEDMVALLDHVRRALAGPNTIFVPEAVDLHLAPATAPQRLVRDEFWSRPHCGFDLSDFAAHDLAVRDWIAQPSVVHLRDDGCLLGPPRCAARFDAGRGTGMPDHIAGDFEIAHDGIHDGYLGFYTIHYHGARPLHTSPCDPPTSWGQFIFPSDRSRPVRGGDRIALDFQPARWFVDWRIKTCRYPALRRNAR